MDSPTLLCIDDRPQALGASQSDSGISWLQRQDRVEQASTAMKMLLEEIVRRPRFYSSTNTKAWTRRP